MKVGEGGGGVNGVECSCGVGSGVGEDCAGAPGVGVKEAGDIIHIVVEDYPAGGLGGVFGD